MSCVYPTPETMYTFLTPSLCATWCLQHGQNLDMDILSSMDVLHRNITEALRMNPPLVLLLRYAKQPFTATTSTEKQYPVPKVCV